MDDSLNPVQNPDGTEVTVMEKSTVSGDLSNLETKSDTIKVNDSCNQEGSSTTVLPEKELNDKPTLVSQSAGSESLEKGSAVSDSIPVKVTQQTPAAAASGSDNENNNKIVVLDKLPLRRNAEQGVTVSKPSGDGYNWRKYGQKLVKGNTFVRSYYKCSFGTCPARKQVERTHEGNITETNYLWKHEHPQILVSHKPPSEDLSSHDQETETRQLPLVPETPVKSNETKSDVSSDSKRQKRETPPPTSMSEGISSTKTNSESRVVVQTTSLVDIVNDGYRWRKYGQKLVKGNPNPRSYYRCTSGGCPAKKHVERASHDEKVVITTYEGRHDHDMPTAAAAPRTGTGATSVDKDGSRPQSESSGMEMVLHVSAT